MEYLDSRNLRITVPVGFKVASPTPIDSRLVVESVSQLYELENNNLAYYGLMVYCEEEDTYYKYSRNGWVSTNKTDSIVSHFSLVSPVRDDNGVITQKGSLSINTKASIDFIIQSIEEIKLLTLDKLTINSKNTVINGTEEIYLDSPKVTMRNGEYVGGENGQPAPVTLDINGAVNISHFIKAYSITIDYLNLGSTKPGIIIGGVTKLFNGHSDVSFSHAELTTILDNTSGYNLSNKLKAKAGNHVAWATLTAAGWSGSAVPYSQTVTVSGITDENPMLISGLEDGASAATQAEYIKAFGIISSGTGTFTVSSQSATFKVYKKPTTDCKIGLKG